MYELLVSGFALDASGRHEYPLMKAPPPGLARVCSKWPEPEFPRVALALDPRLFLLCMMRDPRDVVVSRHRQHPELYWANLGQWFVVHHMARRLERHPRFLLVRYEDLVAEPDAVQDRIAAWLPAIERRARFSEFARVAAPSAGAERALGGLRDIETARIGAWRDAPARVLGQMRLHGDIGPALRAYGYETDEAWRAALDGVEPDTAPGYWADRPRRSLSRRLKRWRNLAGYALRGTAARFGRD